MRRICIVTTGHPPYDDRVFFKEAVSLRKAGFDVRIVCSTGDYDEERHGIRVLGFSTYRFLSTCPFLRVVKLIRLATWLYRQRCEVYHCHEFGALLSAQFARAVTLLFRGRAAFIIYDVHEWFPWSVSWESGGFTRIRSWFTHRLFIAICNRTDHIILNEGLKLSLFSNALSHRRLTVVENFPPLGLFADSRKEFDKERFVIGYAGILSKERGIHHLAQAVQIFSLEHKTRPRLLLVGDFRSPEERNSFLRSYDHTAFDLEITGWLSHIRVPSLMADADVCALPLQRSERTIRCMPVKLYEYMALSKPVIAPDFGEIRRFVTETDCGILVDTSDPHALAAGISYYYEDPRESLRQGKLARSRVEQEFNWAAAEERLLAVYPSPLDSEGHRKRHFKKDYQ